MDDGTKDADEQQPGGGAFPLVNEVTVVGRLMGQPVLKQFGEDKTRAQFTLAVPRRGPGGEAHGRSDFLDVVTWRALAKQAEGLSKGDCVQVWGRVRTWQDENRRFHWEIEADALQVLDRKPQARTAKREEQAKA